MSDVCFFCQVELSLDGDYLRIGDIVCLLHVPTHSVLSAHMSAGSAHEATKILPDTRLSCSKRIQPCPRNVFVIGRYLVIMTQFICSILTVWYNVCFNSWDSSAMVGDPVCYEQHITFTTLPDEGGKVKVCNLEFLVTTLISSFQLDVNILYSLMT